MWAKLNMVVRYVLGMNEIAATIYYVLANDLNVDFAVYAEADTYYLFHTLMSGVDMMRDVFIADMDDSKSGIQGRISNMQQLLQLHDPELYTHLEDIGMDPSFYAIRWLTTLLSREFLLPDTIRLWDSMFSSTHKENFLRYVCGTMVIKVRDVLIKGDFSRCLRLLQSYPPTNVDDILEASRSLWIYESQVTMACHRGGITLNQALHAIHPPPSIIMAFGLQGGIAPTLSDQIHDAAVVVQEQVEQTASGLLWRAKKYLQSRSANSSNADDSSLEATSQADCGAAGKEVPSDSDSQESTKPGITKVDVQPENNGRVSILKKRFWKAWGAVTAADVSEEPPSQEESIATPSIPPTLPPKPRAWNRGRTESYGKSSSNEGAKEIPHNPTKSI